MRSQNFYEIMEPDEQRCPRSNKWNQYYQEVLNRYEDGSRREGVKIDMELATNHGILNWMEFATDHGILNMYGRGN